ncbi:MAG TPA: hypothetical protein VFZ61_18290 [Polyangiales bacterium]
MKSVGLGWVLASCGVLMTLVGCASDPMSSGGAPPQGGGPNNGGGGPLEAGMGAVTVPEAGQAGDAGAAQDTGPMVVTIDAGSGTSDATCAETSSTATIKRQGADIIFAVDSSGSMDEEIVFVQQNLNAFSQQIVKSGVDARVIMLAEADALCIGAPLGSGQCPTDNNPPSYIRIDQEVGSRDVLEVYLDSFPSWQMHLREGTRKFFVVITDDDANNAYTTASFRAAVDQLHPTLFKEWSYSGIFCFSDCEDAARIGAVHQELVSATQGVAGDLCLQDFAPVFNKLAEAIVTGSEIACEWDVPVATGGTKVDPNSVNVRYTDEKGGSAMLGKVESEAECAKFKDAWHYNADKTKILACPETCASMRAGGVTKVDVLLGCKSEPPPSIL